MDGAGGAFLHDLVYSKNRKQKTPVCQLADSHGIKSKDGFDMLVYQAMRAFQIWTGVEVSHSKLIERLENELSMSN